MGTIERFGEDLSAIRMQHRMMGMELGTRSSLVRLGSGGLALISPGPFEEKEFQEIEAMGAVEALIAPNLFHHLFLARAARRFPEAARFYAPGLTEKVGSLPPGASLGEEAPALWSDRLRQHLVQGTSTNEVVFLHVPSRTLILTDLAFNVRSGGLWTRIALRLNAGYGSFGPSRLFRASIRDSAAFGRSLREIAAWDFDRILVAHGEVVETRGNALFRETFDLGDQD